jgi:hypothetical protein
MDYCEHSEGYPRSLKQGNFWAGEQINNLPQRNKELLLPFTWWYRAWRPIHCDYYWCMMFAIWFIIIPDFLTRDLWQWPPDTISREVGESGREMSVNFPFKYLFHIVGIFNIPKYLTTRDRRLYFPSKGIVLRIFIDLKNLWSSAGFETENLGVQSKHDKD